MENLHIIQKDETAWYENDHPIREYLKSSEKPTDSKKDERWTEKPSWREMMKKTLRP